MQVMQLTLQNQVLAASAVIVHARFLRHAADGAAHALRFTQDVNSSDACFTGIRPRQCGENFDSGGFACAVGPEQRENGTGTHAKIQPIERFDATAIGFPKVANLDGKWRCVGVRQSFDSTKYGVSEAGRKSSSGGLARLLRLELRRTPSYDS